MNEAPAIEAVETVQTQNQGDDCAYCAGRQYC
jgi:hypothetical protein